MLTKEEMPACPVATTVQLIGSKWKLLILRNLLARPWRFNELRKDLEGISQKVLADSLRALESDGIVARTVYPEVPPRVEYSLTPLGESMKPILDAMRNGEQNIKNGCAQMRITNKDAGKTPASSFAVSDIFSKVCHHICQSDGFQFPLHSRLNPVQLVIENIMYILSDRTVRVRILVEMEQRIFLYTLHCVIYIQKCNILKRFCYGRSARSSLHLDNTRFF